MHRGWNGGNDANAMYRVVLSHRSQSDRHEHARRNNTRSQLHPKHNDIENTIHTTIIPSPNSQRTRPNDRHHDTLGLTYHITETGLGIVGLHLRTVGLRVKEEGRHGPLGLGGIL